MEKFNLTRFGLFLGVILVSLFCGCHGVVDSVQVNPLPDLRACGLPAVTGPCRANMRRFHFNISTGQCSIFVYGGCQGNANNFVSLRECQAFGNRCLRTKRAPLPTRKPMSSHEPLDLRWVGKYPVIPESPKHHGSGWTL